MATNKGLNFFCSLPIVLLFLYFIPFLGVCLLLTRLIVYRGKIKSSFILIGLGIILLVPNILESICKMIGLDVKSIPLLYDLVYLDIYNNEIISYAKLLLTVGIIFLILSYIAKMIFAKLGNTVRDYIQNQEKIDREVREKNDLIMQEKREKAKNTHVVHCPYCGADNMLTSKTGKCKYCRRNITSEED